MVNNVINHINAAPSLVKRQTVASHSPGKRQTVVAHSPGKRQTVAAHSPGKRQTVAESNRKNVKTCSKLILLTHTCMTTHTPGLAQALQ
jgi:hypothetical protein